MHNETSEALSKGVGALEGRVGPWEGHVISQTL